MGAWVARHLAHAGHEVFILSRSAEGKRPVPLPTPTLNAGQTPASFPADAAFAWLKPPCFVQADCVQDGPERIAACLPENLDAIVHTAGHTAQDAAQGRESLLVNVLGTRNLLEGVRLYAPKKPPVVVYASTFHVYGAVSGRIDEATECRPKNDYALTHLLAEDYCRYYARERGVPAIIYRCANGFGAPACLPFAHWGLLVHDLCRTAVEQGEIILKSPPDIRRSFIAMSEVARAVEALLACSEEACKAGLFNLGGESLSIGHMAGMVAEEASLFLGAEVPLRCLSAPQGVQADSLPELTLDCSRLHTITGFAARQDFRAEIRAILEFLVHHRAGEQDGAR